MLHILFQIGAQACAMDVRAVREVLPFVHCDPLEGAPPWVVGMARRHGALLPVVDPAVYRGGDPARRLASTRILVVSVPLAEETRELGVLVERATDTLHQDPAQFGATGVRASDGRHERQLARDRDRLIHRMDVDALVPPRLRTALWWLPDAREEAA